MSPIPPFAADVLVEALLVFVDIPCQTQFQVGLGLPCQIPVYFGDVSIVLPCSLALFLHPINFFLVFEIY